MSDKLHQTPEMVSLLMDGQLQGEDFDDVLAQLEASSDACRAWDTYHLVGEVMRSRSAHARGHDPQFVQRLRTQLAQNTSEIIAIDAVSIRAKEQNDSKVAAANDGWWRKVAGLASIALVGVMAWQGTVFFGDSSTPTSLAQQGQAPAGKLAAASGTSSATAGATVATAGAIAAGDAIPAMIRDPRLDALLAAHRQFGGTSALQKPSGFLRNATFEESRP
ncbi:MAG: sigma-E factor negative regulatory protein [Comamonadaceae bacterium]|nr:sigma-E factor negative regulatory protein [Comamonadaceae bacterium]